MILSPVWASPDTTGLGAVAVMRGDAVCDGQRAGAKFGILAPCFLPSRPPLPSRCGRQPVHLQGRPLLGGASQRQRQPAPAPARPLARAPCRHRRLRLLPAQPQLLLLQRSVRRRLWLVSVRPVLLCPSGSAPAPPAWCGAGVLGVAGCWGCRLLGAVLVTGSKQMHFGEKMLSGDAQLLVPVIHALCPVPCCPLQAAGGGTAGGAQEGQPRQPGHRGQPELFMETTLQPVRKGALLLRLGESQKPPSAGPDPARPASRKGLLSGAEQCHGSVERAGAGAGPNPFGCSGVFGCPSPGGPWGCLSCCAGGG